VTTGREMAEPPPKRAKRTDSAAMWEKNESTDASKPPRASDDSRDSTRKEFDSSSSIKNRKSYDDRRDDRRRRSRSKDRYRSRRERSRSKERQIRERDRDRDHDRANEDRRPRLGDDERRRDHRGSRREQEEGSPSPGRHASSRGHFETSILHAAMHQLTLLLTDARPLRGRQRHHRSRSRSPKKNGTSTPTRTRSPPRAPLSDRNRVTGAASSYSTSQKLSKSKTEPDMTQVDSERNGTGGAVYDEDSEDAFLRKMMGFSTFKTTQNKKIPGNNVSGVRKEKSTQYRQYMNRTGGFNRPLSPSRD
jgi:U4/U6.U5 tri-snRNP-associated protein 3